MPRKGLSEPLAQGLVHNRCSLNPAVICLWQAYCGDLVSPSPSHTLPYHHQGSC